jgi:hypothetical protein
VLVAESVTAREDGDGWLVTCTDGQQFRLPELD